MNDLSNDSDFVIQSKLQRASSLVLDLLLPHENVALICDDFQYKYRDRIYNPMVTVWLFIAQVISADHSCQQTLTRFNAWRIAKGLRRVSSATKAYCTARSKLPEQLFERLLEWTSQQCEEATNSAWLFKGRGVDMVDGWTVTMADTPLRRVLERIYRGRILLADRYYATFWLLALGETRGIDLVGRAHHLREIDFRKGLKLGYLDQLVVYHNPQRPAWMDQGEYDELPNLIFLRHLKYKVHQKGFRTREIVLATTLLDAELYTAEDLAELYRKRWHVELHIRRLKTQLQMEHLRCKSPQMVHKEIHCHMIGFNLVRTAMLASALKYGRCPTTLSFKGAMQALEEFAACLRLRSGRSMQQWDNLLETASELSVGDRPGRKEERVLKRRPKNYKLMKPPRNPNRNRYATAA